MPPLAVQLLPHTYPTWANSLLEIILAVFIGILAYFVTVGLIQRLLRRAPTLFGEVLAGCLKPPSRFAFPVAAVALARLRERLLEPDAAALSALDRLIQVAVIIAITWLAVSFTGALVTYAKRKNPIAPPPPPDPATPASVSGDNREARRIHTQATVVGRSVQVVLIFLGIGAALLTFPRVQQFGTSILASAGIAGIAIGIAARPVLENLIAGVQIGFTQPIRLDDVVVIEGEWGRVEEINLTYIVVRVWDDRRIVLPFSKFINEPFQNWSRTSTQITGTVFLHVDYTADITRIREKAKELVTQLPKWDGRVYALHVTDATDRTLQIRILISAPDAGASWENRTSLREQLITWLQADMPHALPRNRVDSTQIKVAETPHPPPHLIDPTTPAKSASNPNI